MDDGEVGVDESIKVEPDGVDGIFLEGFDDFMRLESVGEFKHLDILHKHVKIHVLGNFLVLLEGLSFYVHRFPEKIEHYQQFFYQLEFQMLPFLLTILLTKLCLL